MNVIGVYWLPLAQGERVTIHLVYLISPLSQIHF